MDINCQLFTDCLSVDSHLQVVRHAVWEVRSDWCDLGVELDISHDTLMVYHLRQSITCNLAILYNYACTMSILALSRHSNNNYTISAGFHLLVYELTIHLSVSLVPSTVLYNL